ncbi:YjbH domain-containing protein [Bacteroidota bacterium]
MNRIIFNLLITNVLISSSVIGQSIIGVDGLISVPTAYIVRDGSISVGVYFINKEYSVLEKGKRHNIRNNITISFLPFWEISLILNNLLNSSDPNQGIGDRMISTKFTIINEFNYYLAIAIGFHDILTSSSQYLTSRENAAYIVASKSYCIENFIFGFSVGHGWDLMNAGGYKFLGLFGGIDLKYAKTFSILVEYDAERFNGGIKLIMFDHVTLLIGLMNLASWNGGVSFNFQL